MKYETLIPSTPWLISATAAALVMGFIVAFFIRRLGNSQVRNFTLIPVCATLVFLLGFHGRDLDLNYSARPLAQAIARQAPGKPLVATLGLKRDLDYGLAFYRNQQTIHYDDPAQGVPAAEHILVTPSSNQAGIDRYLTGRIYEPLFLYETQGLSIYRVYPVR